MADSDFKIPEYPEFREIDLSMRSVLHPYFKNLEQGISELTFANIYLFRHVYKYSISFIEKDCFVLWGRSENKTFFIIPFILPKKPILDSLFQRFDYMKCVSQFKGKQLLKMGYRVIEDGDNHDYLYLRKILAELSGRKWHKKRNLIKRFLKSHKCIEKKLSDQFIQDALMVLENWNEKIKNQGDYLAAREALEKMDVLELKGSIYFVDDKPAAYVLGEEVAKGESFAIHFEKAIGDYKGIWQFINQAFALSLTDKVIYINREQDLGIAGLRKAKKSYRPVDFVKKYQALL